MKISKIIKNNSIVIHTFTNEQAMTLVEESEKHGVIWNFKTPDAKVTEHNTRWNEYREHTCYDLGRGSMNNIAYYFKLGRKVVTFDEIEFDKWPSKSEFIVMMFKQSSPAIIEEVKNLFISEKLRTLKYCRTAPENAVAFFKKRLKYLNSIIKGMGWE